MIAGTHYIVAYMRETFKHIAGDAFAPAEWSFEALGLDKKMVIVPPGMDPEVFKLLESVRVNEGRFLKMVEKAVRMNPGQCGIFKSAL